MVSKELKKLNRRELVDIIYQLKKNEQDKQEKITALEEELQEKRIRISVAGSIAEAATDISQVFSAAQKAADLYLNEIACMKEDTEEACAQMIEEARKQAKRTLMEHEKQLSNIKALYRMEQKKLQKLRAEVQRLEERVK